MSWTSITMRAPRGDADALCDFFLGLGALSTSITYNHAGKARQSPQIDLPSESMSCLRGSCSVSALVERRGSIHGLLEEAKAVFLWDQIPRYTLTPIEDRDWVCHSQEKITPLLVQEKLWIVPTWHNLPDPDALHVRLDPGRAFGTGHHATTRLCLEWLVSEVRGGETVLDYGCGSGVLAIAALKLGARNAVGVDTDPRALDASLANARLNGVDLRLFESKEIPSLQADLVLANILANPLKAMVSILSGHTRKGGKAALSGILVEQVEDVSAIYEPWFQFASPVTESGWALLVGTKR